MAPSVRPQTASLRAWLKTHPYSLLAALVLLALAVPFCTRQDGEWDSVFVGAGERLWQGDDISRREDGSLYPPFMAWAALPFVALPVPAGRAAWLAINAVCLVLLFRG